MPEKLGPRQPRNPEQAARARRQVRVAVRTQYPTWMQAAESAVRGRDWGAYKRILASHPARAARTRVAR
jgi:hypothetical protein